MSDFKANTLAILGRQPLLGMAELERLYGAQSIRPLDGGALLELPVNEIQFKRLGGAVKLAKVLTILPTTRWGDLTDYLKNTIPKHLRDVPDGTFTLGLSVHGMNIEPAKINRDLLAIKKVIRQTKRSVRIVPNKSTSLNSAQVLHNKLTSRGGWELIIFADGSRTVLAQTMFVQDINAYAARDQARPARDPRVGMLPPKLAQIMINLANPPQGGIILDPFCGSGVVLQEAVLMGYRIIGSDVDSRMVEFAKTNLEWLAQKHHLPSGRAQLINADATKHEWRSDIDATVSETYLGEPLNAMPGQIKLSQMVDKVNETTSSFLLNISRQLKPKSTLCLAIAAWKKPDGNFITLPLIDRLTDMGYNYLDLEHVEREDLTYFRENQFVARQLLVLEKS